MIVLFALLLAVTHVTPVLSADRTYTASVALIDECPADSNETPTVSLSNTLVPRKERTAVTVRSQYVSTMWNFQLSMPVSHAYIWINTTHCEAHFPSMSVNGQSRHYTGILAPGRDGNLDEGDRFLAGVLPLQGIVSVDLVSAKRPSSAEIHGLIDGNAYYFENVPAGLFEIRLCLSYFARCVYFPIETLDRTDPIAPFHKVRNFTLDEIHRAAANAYQ